MTDCDGGYEKVTRNEAIKRFVNLGLKQLEEGNKTTGKNYLMSALNLLNLPESAVVELF